MNEFPSLTRRVVIFGARHPRRRHGPRILSPKLLASFTTDECGIMQPMYLVPLAWSSATR
ncbi:hypothetical protein Rcae01_00284 [Novipirellula caenicola]|uniref:Uncharacterized protein n=1 Tax=Novipirellula caenicola TaxID=1536901 RepID=A0ABP9VKN1_9BACT